MNAILLDNHIGNLRKCYIGEDKDGLILLDKSKIGDLYFGISSTIVNKAILQNKITETELIEKIKENKSERKNQRKSIYSVMLGFLRKPYLYFFQPKSRVPQLPR